MNTETLHEILKRLESSFESFHKDTTQLRSDFNAFVEVSNLKEKSNQEQIQSVLGRMDKIIEEQKERLQKLADKMKEKEAEEVGLQKGKDKIVAIANAIKWILTTALALLGLVFWGKK